MFAMTNIVPPRHDPRRCGAFYAGIEAGIDRLGSSPQVRGIYRDLEESARVCGIIPAGAGHLRDIGSGGAVVLDHPRRCGAFRLDKTLIGVPTGSSPQVRGIFSDSQFFVIYRGIIPAGAGHFACVEMYH